MLYHREICRTVYHYAREHSNDDRTYGHRLDGLAGEAVKES